MPAELLAGRALASAPVKATWRNGAARTTRTTTADSAQMTGRRMTRVAIRYQRPVAGASPVAEVRWRRDEVCAAMRSPKTVRSDGRTKQGEGAGRQDDDRAGDPHRVDEALGEDGEGGHAPPRW